jgi:hypothetical protein
MEDMHNGPPFQAITTPSGLGSVQDLIWQTLSALGIGRSHVWDSRDEYVTNAAGEKLEGYVPSDHYYTIVIAYS